MNLDLRTYISQLDGYLGGIAAIDGKLRQFTAYAFSLEGGEKAPQEQLREFFEGQVSFTFENAHKLDGGLKQLELEIQALLLQDPFGGAIAGNPDAIADRRRFLSFRIIDLVEQVAPEARDLNCAWRFHGKADISKSICTFFCVKTGGGYLVLQFNDDSAQVGVR